MLDAITSTETTPSELTVSPGQEQRSQFLQLLVAQLKGQDPLNPLEGTDFVAQLAQFTSLEELINIRETMEQVQKTMDNVRIATEGVQTTLEGRQDAEINSPF